jgi:putative exporter of polyketide antibiotics
MKKNKEIYLLSVAFAVIGVLGMLQNDRNDKAIGAVERVSSFNANASSVLASDYMAIQPTSLDYDLQPTEYESSNPQQVMTGYVLQAQPIDNSRFQGSYSTLQNARINVTE